METSKSTASRPLYAWAIVFAAFLCFGVVYGTALYSFPVFVNPVAKAFAVSPTQVLIGFTLLNVGMGLLGILGGPALARFGIRNVVVAGLVLLSGGFFLLSQVTSLLPFYLVYGVIIAFGSTVVANLGASALVTNWFVANRGRALTVAILGTSAGQLFIPQQIAKVIEAGGWAAGYRTFSVIMLVVAVIVAFIAVDRPEKRGTQAWGAEQSPQEERTAAPRLTAGQILGRPDFWVIAGSYLLTVVVYLALGATMIPYARTFGVTGPQAAQLASVMGLSAAIGKLGFASWTDRMGLRNTFWIAVALNLAAVTLLWTTHDYNILFVVSALVGASSGGILPVWPGLVATRFGRGALPQVMGLMSPMVVALQGFGAPFVLAMHFKPAYLVFAVMLVGSAILSRNLSKPTAAPALP